MVKPMKHIRIRDEPTNNAPRRRKKSASANQAFAPARVRQKSAHIKGKGEHEYIPRHGNNVVMLADLCKEYDVNPITARQLLRRSELKHTGRWKWRKGSLELNRARTILSKASRT